MFLWNDIVPTLITSFGVFGDWLEEGMEKCVLLHQFQLQGTSLDHKLVCSCCGTTWIIRNPTWKHCLRSAGFRLKQSAPWGHKQQDLPPKSFAEAPKPRQRWRGNSGSWRAATCQSDLALSHWQLRSVPRSMTLHCQDKKWNSECQAHGRMQPPG